jgi:ribosome-associated heat shock protein Hsp15
MTRIDKWLWAARFFKTRSLAQQAIERGRVRLAGERVKTSREVRIGDTLSLDQDDWVREVEVRAVAEIRGPARVAQGLYLERADSVAAKERALERARERRRLFPEPAHSILRGRPTKVDRRALGRLKG